MQSKIRSNIIWSYSGQVTTLVVGILGSIILARYLGPDGRGIYALILASAEFLTELIGKNSFIVAFTYYSGKGLLKLNQIFNQAVLYVLIVGVSAALLIRLLLKVEVGGFKNLTYYDMWVCIAYGFAITYWGVTSGILIGLDQIKLNNLVILANNVFTLVSQGFLLVTLGLGIMGGRVQILLTSAFLVLVSTVVLFRRIDFKFSVDWQATKKLSAFAGKLYPGYIGNLMLMQIDLIILGLFTSSYSLGIYSVAKGLILPIALLEPPITQSLVPTIASDDPAHAIEVLTRGFRLLFWLLAFIVFLVGLTFPYLIPLIYGQEFKDVNIALLLLLPGQFSVASRTLYSYFTYQIGRPELLTYFSIATGLISLPIYISLSYWQGYIGLSLAVSCVLLFKFIIVILLYSFLTKQKIHKIFLLDKHDLQRIKGITMSIRSAFIQ